MLTESILEFIISVTPIVMHNPYEVTNGSAIIFGPSQEEQEVISTDGVVYTPEEVQLLDLPTFEDVAPNHIVFSEETGEDGLFDPLDNHTVINGKLPTTGDANSSMDYIDDAGDLIRRRFFDENGNVIKDVDFTDHGNPKLHPDVPHEHYWEWNDGIPKRLK